MIDKHEMQMWTNEGGIIDKSIRPAINKAMREAHTFVDLRTLPSIKDKRAKAISFCAMVSAGAVWLPRGQAWAEDLVDQCVSAPAGRYDDKYDVCGLFGRMIDQLVKARPLPGKRRDGIKPFTAEWLEYDETEKARGVQYR